MKIGVALPAQIVGIAVGGREPDFQAAGVPMRTRGQRLEEAVALLKQAWAGGPVDYDGSAFQVRLPPMGPRTVQQPSPPVWMGGFAEQAAARMKEFADLGVDTLILVPVVKKPEQVDRLAEAVAALRP